MNESSSSGKRYALVHLAIGHDEEIAISKAEYVSLCAAQRVLQSCRFFEEKFLAICEEYKQLEIFIFSITLDDLLYSHSDVSTLHANGAYFGRRALTFLSVVRLYIDSVGRHSEEILISATAKAEVKAILSQKYDESYPYRVMEALRNSSQHHSFPITGATYGARWTDDFSEMLFSSDFYFDLNEMTDAKLKSSVAAEILSKGSRFELKTGIRDYFAQLCAAHMEIRALFDESSKKAFAAIDQQRSKWIKKFNSQEMALVAACVLEEGHLHDAAEQVPISVQAYEYMSNLVRRTGHLVNMGKRRIPW